MRYIAIAVLTIGLSGCYVNVNVNVTRAEAAAEPVTGCVTDTECDALGIGEATHSAYLSEA